MNKLPYQILRIGTGVTFVWLGLLIWQAPDAWASFVQPWAANLLPSDLAGFMKKTAIGDIVIGIWLIIGWKAWVASLLATIHLGIVLVTTTGGWSNIVVRDIALFAACLALFVQTAPVNILAKLGIKS